MHVLTSAILVVLLAARATTDHEQQPCDSDCIQLVAAVLEWVSTSENIPIAELTVDAQRSGYIQSAEPWLKRSRLITSDEITALSGTLGFSIAPIVDFDKATYVTFSAPEITGDSAKLSLSIATYADRKLRRVQLGLKASRDGWSVRNANVLFTMAIDFIPVSPPDP